ncbi:MAG: hypothetical protein F6K31_28345 [Symploca sp. SIO2G7]|nr:hypothetical protein [Symploca sp. SIO2G7]
MSPEEQAKALIELSKLKVKASQAYNEFESFASILDKILKSGELLTEEECQLASSKEFHSAITAIANCSSKLSVWYKENDSQEAIAFLSLSSSATEVVETSTTE